MNPSHWLWPQWLFLAFVLTALVIAVKHDGKPRTGESNAVASFVAWGWIMVLLIEGGFFK